MLVPPFSDVEHYLSDLRQRGFAVLTTATTRALAGVSSSGLAALTPDWAHWHPMNPSGMAAVATMLHSLCRAMRWPRGHPLAYHTLHSRMLHWFAPVATTTLLPHDWWALLSRMARVTSALRGDQPWWAKAHQFRIDTADGIGRPTPEDAHRDGG